MSQFTMTIIDPHRAIHGQPHGSFLDDVVAALSADPETIEELEAAMARFMEIDGDGPFTSWLDGVDDEPYDAGACVIDLGARFVAAGSTYSLPFREGQVQYRCGDCRHDDDPCVSFQLSDDWVLRFEMTDWQGEADHRRAKRLAEGRLDFRKVLYEEVCLFIVEQCLAARGDQARVGDWTPPPGWTFSELPERVGDDTMRLAEHAVAEIHARWLMTPRDDLRGQSPRDVLLTGREHIDADLWSRCNQWSVFRACPPPLSRESVAFRFGPCGTHEYVLYYDMVRDLINNCWRNVVGPISSNPETPLPDAAGGLPCEAGEAGEIAQLRAVQQEWLTTPGAEGLGGRTPLETIESERMRIPMKMSADDVMVDPDCPLCQMAADDSEFGPSFWHLDGCNMDQDYPFSTHLTREAWEQEEREWEEHRRKFDEDWQAKQAAKPAGGDTDDSREADEAWGVSFSEDAPATVPLTVRLFSIGAALAELGQELKQSADTQPYVDALNRHFGNLRAALQDGGSFLVEPVIARFLEELHTVRTTRPSLGSKCRDLDRQLREFAAYLSEAEDGWDEEADWDAEPPS